MKFNVLTTDAIHSTRVSIDNYNFRRIDHSIFYNNKNIIFDLNIFAILWTPLGSAASNAVCLRCS